MTRPLLVALLLFCACALPAILVVLIGPTSLIWLLRIGWLLVIVVVLVVVVLNRRDFPTLSSRVPWLNLAITNFAVIEVGAWLASQSLTVPLGQNERVLIFYDHRLEDAVSPAGVVGVSPDRLWVIWLTWLVALLAALVAGLLVKPKSGKISIRLPYARTALIVILWLASVALSITGYGQLMHRFDQTSLLWLLVTIPLLVILVVLLTTTRFSGLTSRARRLNLAITILTLWLAAAGLTLIPYSAGQPFSLLPPPPLYDIPASYYYWNPPSHVHFQGSVVVSATVTGAITSRGALPQLEGSSNSRKGTLLISPVMAMDLTSDDDTALRIRSLDPNHREKPIRGTDNSRDSLLSPVWQWRLTAQDVGTWRIRLRGYMRDEAPNAPVKETTAFGQEYIDVTVDPDPPRQALAFVSANSQWSQWLWTVLLAPLIYALIRLFKWAVSRTVRIEEMPSGEQQGTSSHPGRHIGRKWWVVLVLPVVVATWKLLRVGDKTRP